MKRKEIVERIAEDKAIPHRTAGDWLDSFLYELIEQLKVISSPAVDSEVESAPALPEPEAEMKAPRVKGRR